MRLFDRTICIEYFEASRLTFRDLKICITDARVEIGRLCIHSILPIADLMPFRHSTDRVLDRDIEEQCEVGLQTAGRKIDYLVYRFFRKAAAGTLISVGRIGIPVRYHGPAFAKCRFDEEFDVLRSISRKKQQFGHWS